MATMTRDLPEDEDALAGLIDLMEPCHKIAFAAGYAQRLLVVFEGVRDGQWQYFDDLLTPALDQAWTAAQGTDVDTSQLATINADLLANIPNDQDPNLEFTWETEALGSVVSAVYACVNVVLVSDSQQALAARRAFTDFLDFVVADSGRATQEDYLQHSDFFQQAITLIDNDFKSSTSVAAHRALTSRQGADLLAAIAAYLGPKPW
ncbi:hypothetical protein QN239_06035 [Mycolicibacterium sp. Y3]